MKIAAKIIFVLYALVISFLSLRPDTGVAGPFAHADKIVHFFLYGGFVALGLMASTGRTPPWFIITATIVFSTAHEVAQPYFGRSFDLIDIAANVAGAAVGYGLTLAALRKLSGSKV